MADSLQTRVGRVIAGSVHALLDRIEDQLPEAMLEQSLRDADEVVQDVRHALGQVSANRHLAQQQHAKLNRQHDALTGQVAEALGHQRDDLASAAVARQLDIEAQLPVLEATLSDHARQEAELQGYVAALLAKKREMQEALADYRTSRAAAASAAGTPGNAADPGAAQRMDRVTEAFDKIYQRQTGLSGAARGASLQQAAQLKELEDLSRDRQIAERLARLKASLA